MPSQPTHCQLFAQKPFPLLRQLCSQDLDRNSAIQCLLPTAKNDAEPTPADLLGTNEPGRTQFLHERSVDIPLRLVGKVHLSPRLGQQGSIGVMRNDRSVRRPFSELILKS